MTARPIPQGETLQSAWVARLTEAGPWLSWTALALVMVVTIGAWQWAAQREASHLQSEFNARTAAFHSSLQHRISSYETVLRGAAALFRASDRVTRMEWSQYLATLELPIQYPALQAVAFARAFTEAERPAVEALQRAEGFDDFRIWPEGVRSRYVANAYTEPHIGLNVRAIGFDLWQEPVRRAMLERALASGLPVISGRLTLRIDDSSQPVPAFIMCQAARDQSGRVAGYVLAPFRLPALLESLPAEAREGISVTLYDGATRGGEALLMRFGEAGQESALQREEVLEVGGRRWTLSFSAASDLPQRVGVRNPHWVLAVGSLVAFLLFWLIRTLAATQRRARELADGMTAELEQYRRHLEALVDARTHELLIAKDAAEAANVAKSAFLANMSHEIRTPLHAISGMAALIRRESLTPRQTERLDKLEAAGRHLLEIIDAVLELSRIEANKLTLANVPLDLTRLCEEVGTLLAGRATAKGVALNVELPPPVNVTGDATRLRQALLGYLENAIKFTHAGHVTLRTTLEAEYPHTVMLRFTVEDTGIGIAPETLENLFMPFEQADNSETRRYGGTGLGLVIVRRLAHMMGGEAGATSVPGRGSVFWFTARLNKATETVLSDADNLPC